jgi:antitoxin (DNA-binding transcriptional repressor) of toxin-antitoxin stability system
MKTTSVSNLKAHLSEMLRAVKAGEEVVVLEHRRPVALIRPHSGDSMILREASTTYTPGELSPLIATDPRDALSDERADRW